MTRAALVAAAMLLFISGEGLAAQNTAPPPTPSAVVEALADATRVAEGVDLLHALLPTLSPSRATLWIRLLAVTERSGPEATAVAARGLHATDEDRDPLRGATLIEEAVDEVEEADRAALLGFAAHLADPVDPDRASRLRGVLLEAFPDSFEAPEAAFLRARWLLNDPGSRPAGVELLEELVVRRPNHSIAPEARRLLQQARGPGGMLR